MAPKPSAADMAHFMNVAECVQAIRAAVTTEERRKAVGRARFLVCTSVCAALPMMCSNLVAAGVVGALAVVIKEDQAIEVRKNAIGVVTALSRTKVDFEKTEIVEALRSTHVCTKVACEVCWLLERLE